MRQFSSRNETANGLYPQRHKGKAKRVLAHSAWSLGRKGAATPVRWWVMYRLAIVHRNWRA